MDSSIVPQVLGVAMTLYFGFAAVWAVKQFFVDRDDPDLELHDSE